MGQEVYSADQIAEKLLTLSKDSGGLDNLKLQKILYFAQAISLVRNNKPLFKEDLEAWNYGPVVESVYRKYKSSEDSIISHDSNKNIEISQEDLDVLKDTLETFKNYTGEELIEMTHKHKPFMTYFKEDENAVIPVNFIKEYYTGAFK